MNPLKKKYLEAKILLKLEQHQGKQLLKQEKKEWHF